MKALIRKDDTRYAVRYVSVAYRATTPKARDDLHGLMEKWPISFVDTRRPDSDYGIVRVTFRCKVGDWPEMQTDILAVKDRLLETSIVEGEPLDAV